MAEPPKTWRRWFRFRLRSLLIVWLAVPAWLGWWVHCAREQRDAVANIRNLTDGAVIGYSYQMVPTDSEYWPSVDPAAASWVPNFALEGLGKDFFHNVVSAEIRDKCEGEELELATQLVRLKNLQRLRLQCEPTDPMLTRLVGFGELKSLQLWIASSDDTLRIISGLPKLEALMINWGEFTNAELAHLIRLRSLKYLLLERTNDAGLTRLARLRNLEELYILPGNWRLPHVTGKGVAQLAACTRLRILWLRRSDITDDDLRHFAALNTLESLSLESAEISGVGFQHLTESNLKRLYLPYTPVTDEAAAYLARLPHLEAIDLRGSDVTVNGLEHFKASPQLRRLVISMPATTTLGILLEPTLGPILKAILGPEVELSRLNGRDVKHLQQLLPRCKIDESRDF